MMCLNVWCVSWLRVFQARQFGSSPFLQAGDYQAPADVYGFADRYLLSATDIKFPMTAEGNALLSQSRKAQFRVTLQPSQYSNFNGAYVPATAAPRRVLSAVTCLAKPGLKITYWHAVCVPGEGVPSTRRSVCFLLSV